MGQKMCNFKPIGAVIYTFSDFGKNTNCVKIKSFQEFFFSFYTVQSHTFNSSALQFGLLDGQEDSQKLAAATKQSDNLLSELHSS